MRYRPVSHTGRYLTHRGWGNARLMFWPFGRKKRRIKKAMQEYRRASAELHRANRTWRIFGRRERAIRKAARNYEQAQAKLRKLGVLEEAHVYPRNWDTLRRHVYARDRHRCTMCGAKKSRKVTLHAHHIVPLSQGGMNTLDNLTTLCSSCHKLVHGRR